jgi:hypothetical protein
MSMVPPDIVRLIFTHLAPLDNYRVRYLQYLSSYIKLSKLPEVEPARVGTPLGNRSSLFPFLSWGSPRLVWYFLRQKAKRTNIGFDRRCTLIYQLIAESSLVAENAGIIFLQDQNQTHMRFILLRMMGRFSASPLLFSTATSSIISNTTPVLS